MKLKKLTVLVAIAAASGSAFATDGYFAHGYGMKAKGMGGAATAMATDAMGGANNPVSVTVALTPGANYFLMVDGFGGDECDFTITVNPPSAVQAPPIGNVIGLIPASICS